MQDAGRQTFIHLFKDAFKKCFGADLLTNISETEFKHFSNRILEETGLVIGAKSLKNYAAYALNPDIVKPENPSIATLDTLARYVLGAPYTDEVKRKEKEKHFPYWFRYRNELATKYHPDHVKETFPARKIHSPAKSFRMTIILIMALVLVMVLFFIYFPSEKKAEYFTDEFRNVENDSLKANGWLLQAEDSIWWNKRDETPSHLSLFTLQGDNWADSTHAPIIKNLLIRKIRSDCFTAEVHLDSFMPLNRWQQAGILLLEDTGFTGKSLRLSIAFNDFFGGFDKPGEIIVQAISSSGSHANNPEEIIHMPLFSLEPGRDSLVAGNLRKSALRIEKSGTRYRFLFATGQVDNFAFKEALGKDLHIQPKYIGIFALQGFVAESNFLPARFNYFSLIGEPCEK